MKLRIPLLLFLLATCAAAQNPRDTYIASASQDKRPRVGIAAATTLEGAVREAVAAGEMPSGGLEQMVQRDDWVLILCGPGAPLEAVRALVDLLAAAGRGARFTIAGPGLASAAGLAVKDPRVRVEAVDLDRDEKVEAPVPGGGRTYAISKMLQQCDRVITVAPLADEMSFGAYRALAHGAPSNGEALLDLFSFHPADYALLAGGRLAVAGAHAVAVDTIGAVIAGRDLTGFGHLSRATALGLGTNDRNSIWLRGTALEEAQKLWRDTER